MKKTLKLRMIFWIWGITALTFILVFYVNFSYTRDQEIRELQETSVAVAGFYSKKFEQVFASAAIIPQMTAIRMGTLKKETKDEIADYLKKVVEKNPDIYGAALAFEPGILKGGSSEYAPYFFHKNNRVNFVQLANPKYNYREKNWYRIPASTGKPYWSDPYFDEGGGDVIMVTYSVPFFRGSKLAGVATVDISLENLTDEISRIKVTKTGYGFIVNQTGYFLSFPDKSKILRGNIFDYDKDLAQKVVSGQSGFEKGNDPLHKAQSWVVFHPISIANFSIGIVFPESEIMANIYSMQRYAVVVSFLGLLLLLLVIILLANSITRPLTDLVEAVKYVSRGEYDHRINTKSNTYELITLEMSFNKMTDNIRTSIESLKQLTAEKENLFASSIRALANSIEARDFYTRGHSERVTEYSVKIAQVMGMKDEDVTRLRYAALLHDIGKINVPEDILHKPGRLTEEEYNIMKQHPVQGAKILRPVEEFKEMLPFLYHHHERYDKQGYPTGLGGNEIPLEARILAVADSFDAMTSDRPYRKGMEINKAIDELEKNKSTQFDPKVADVFITVIKNESDWLKSVMEGRFFAVKN